MINEPSDITRRLENLLQVGTIENTDHEGMKLRVRIGEIVTGWIPWPCHIGRNFIAWQPLRINTQVILACPSGDLANAVIIGNLYQNTQLPPSTAPAVDIVQWDNGARVAHNIETGQIDIRTPGDVHINAGGHIRLNAGKDVHINAQNVRVFE